MLRSDADRIVNDFGVFQIVKFNFDPGGSVLVSIQNPETSNRYADYWDDRGKDKNVELLQRFLARSNTLEIVKKNQKKS